MSTLEDLQSEVLNVAADHIRGQREKRHDIRTISVCVSILLAVALVCGTVLACHTISEQQETIREQQWVIASQYDQLASLLSGAEVVTEEYTDEAQTDDGGTAIAGSGNTYVGGDLIGNGEK